MADYMLDFVANKGTGEVSAIIYKDSEVYWSGTGEADPDLIVAGEWSSSCSKTEGSCEEDDIDFEVSLVNETITATGLMELESWTFATPASNIIDDDTSWEVLGASEVGASTTQLDAPSITSHSNVTDTTATFAFSSVANADHYELQLATNSAFTNNLLSFQNVSKSGYTAEGLTAYTNYYVRVKAIAPSNGNYSDSEWSDGSYTITTTLSHGIQEEPMAKIIYKNNLYLEATPSADQHIVNKTYVDSAINGLSSTYQTITAATNASNLTSGTVAVARLPLATTSTVGAISVGDGLSVSDAGALKVNVVTAFVTSGDNANITNATQAPSVKAVYDFVSGGYSASNHTHTLSGVTDAGTAAACNTGTSSGNVPILDNNGKLASSVIPAVALTDVTVVANIAARDALATDPGVQEGDVAIVTDSDGSGNANTYIYDGSEWKEIKTPADGVLSVNSKTGSSITLDASDVSAIASSALSTAAISSASVDTTVSSSKAVYTFASNASNLASGTVAADRLPLATTEAVGAVKVGTGLAVASGVISLDILGTVTSDNAGNTDKAVSISAVKAYTDTLYAPITATYSELTVTSGSNSYTASAPSITADTYIATQDIVAAQFSEDSTYAVGDYVVKDGYLYECSSAVSTAGAWNDSNWTKKTVVDAIDNDIDTVAHSIASEFSASSTYAVGDYVVKDGVLYKCTTKIETAAAWDSSKWTAVSVMDTMSSKIAEVVATIGKYTGSITGDGTTKSFEITHDLGTQYVDVKVIDGSGNLCILPITYTSTSKLSVEFFTAPTASETFTVIVKE